MSTARRAYDILRGYVNDGWDRIQGGEEGPAERELREAIEQPYEPSTATAKKVDAEVPVSSMSVETARRLLDVPANATTKQIAAAHDKLRAGVDPNRFPNGSDAQARARHLLFLIGAAHRVLCENIDPTIKRFEGLEIE